MRPSELPPALTPASGDGPPPDATFAEPADTLSDEARRARTEGAFWTAAAALHRWRFAIAGVTLLTAIAAVVVSLMLPKWYAATARVLPPESAAGGGGLSALIGNLSPIASSLLGGGGGGDYTRYLAILNSETMQNAVIDRFDLIRAYELEDKRYPREAAQRALRKNVVIAVDMEYEYLEITAYDRDPNRAAQIASFYVDELNRRNEELALQGAGRFREYVEERYREIENNMAEARSAMQAFQERHGVIELPTMAQGLIESVASARVEVARAETQYEALRALYGDENPEVQASAQALAAARRAQNNLLGGREAVMPVPLRRLPAVASEYAALYQELLIQQALLEQARPLLEQARFDEERDRVAVQVLDAPAVPERKARPKRAVIVLSATLSALLLCVLVAIGAEFVRRRRQEWALAFARARQR